MIKSLFNWGIHVGLFFILFSGQNGTPWFGNKIRDFILMGSLIIVSGLINFIPNFYKRPVIIQFNQKNKVTKKENTNYIRNESSLNQRSVDIEMNITRRIGWNWLLNKYLERNTVFVKIETNPRGLHLQAVDELQKPKEIYTLVDGSGFLINITDFLRSINQHRKEGNFLKKEAYFIKETRENKNDYINADASFYVNPVLVVNSGERSPFWLNWALKWDPSEHKIEYYQNGRN